MEPFEVLKDGEWVEVSEEEFRSFTGRRKCSWMPGEGQVEYHGPAFLPGTDAPTRETRECRCGTCTLFEPGRQLEPAVQSAVDYMLRG